MWSKAHAPARPGADACEPCCAWRPTAKPPARRRCPPDVRRLQRAASPPSRTTRLVSGRHIAPTDIAAYFHTGGTTGAPKLARHSHGAQVFTAWACVQLQGVRAATTWPSTATRCSTWLVCCRARWPRCAPAPKPSFRPPRCCATRRSSPITGGWWRRYRATVAVRRADRAGRAGQRAGRAMPTSRHAALRPHRRRAHAAPSWPRAFEKADRPAGARKPGHDRDGRHLHHYAARHERAARLRRHPPALYPDAHRGAGRAGQRQRPRRCRRANAAWCCSSRPTCSRASSTRPTTPSAFTADGWLATGDLGWIDEQGRLNLSGRSKDLIIRSGHNIDPKVIEDALGAHPAVQLCAAVGAPDAYAGELPVVFATLHAGRHRDRRRTAGLRLRRRGRAAGRPRRVTMLEHHADDQRGQDLQAGAAGARGAGSEQGRMNCKRPDAARH